MCERRKLYRMSHIGFYSAPRPLSPALSVSGIVNEVGAALWWLGKNWGPLGF